MQRRPSPSSRAPGSQAGIALVLVLWVIALLSVNLAVINIQPIIPVLDGGQLVFLLVEKIRGRPLAMNVRIKFQYVGILAVIGLTVFVTYNDIMRFLSQ